MVEADKTIKIKRLIDAGNLSSEQIKSRMKSQMSDKEMKKICRLYFTQQFFKG